MAADVVAMPGCGPRAEALGAPPVETIVERLDELLALARAGEIRAFAYVFVDPRGAVFDNWVTSPNEPTGHQLIAGAAYLQHELVVEKCAVASVSPPVVPTDPA